MAATGRKKNDNRETIEIRSTFEMDEKPPVTAQDYIYVQPAGEAGNAVIHPRRRHLMLKPAQLAWPAAVHGPMAQWYNDNVLGPTQRQDLYTGHVLPQSLLVAWGPHGMGRATFAAQFCKRHNVELIFVTSFVQCITRIAYAMQMATRATREGRRCLLYFDGADWIAKNADCIMAFIGCYNAEIAPALARPWVVLSMVTKIDDIHPELRTLVRVHGAAVPVLPPADKDGARIFVRSLLSQLSSEEAFPPADTRWDLMVDKLADYATFCTLGEVYEGLLTAFRTHHCELQRTGKPPSTPPLTAFEEVVKRLPWFDSVHTFSYCNPRERLESARGVWESFLRITGQSAGFTYSDSISSSSSSSAPAHCPSTPSYYDADLPAGDESPNYLGTPSALSYSPASPAYEPVASSYPSYAPEETYVPAPVAATYTSVDAVWDAGRTTEKRARYSPSKGDDMYKKNTRQRQQPSVFTSWKVAN